MEVSSRRKACDLCFKKKIRCDGLKPTCSNCSLYKSSCKTTTIRKRPSSSHKQHAVAAVVGVSTNTTNETGAGDSVDTRLARIEAKLDTLRGVDGGTSFDQFFGLDAPGGRVTGISIDPKLIHTPLSTQWPGPTSRDGPPVPPLTEALPLIELFFQNYNSLIPLFDQQSFIHLMNEYYKPYGQKAKIYGAIINIIVSLGYRVQMCGNGDAHPGFNEHKVKACVDNIQGMLDELMVRDQDTLGLQVLLGLVILYQTNPDQTASSVLMSAAMRLAHSLRLGSDAALAELSPQDARQRSNIFWVCYMLDKDTSLRTVTPSLQVDSDIDIHLPNSTDEKCGSLLYSADGQSQFHLFRARVQLAHLEGKIYDKLFSNRSRRLSPEARARAILQIDKLLEQWEQSIPAPFRLDNISGNLLSGPLVHMTVLYQTYLMCLTMTHGLYAQNSPWLKALGGLGSDLLRMFNPRSDTCVGGPSPSNSAVWGKCVAASRAILKILSYRSISGCGVWLSACAYFSATTFVFVNLIHHPTSRLAADDHKLAELSMVQLQKYFDYKGLEKFKQLRHVLTQIEAMAKSGLKDTGLSLAPTTTSPLRLFLDSTTFPPQTSPHTDVLSMVPVQNPTNEEPVSLGLDWLDFPELETSNTDLGPHAWPVSGTGSFFGFQDV